MSKNMTFQAALKHWAAWLLSDRVLNTHAKDFAIHLASKADGVILVSNMQDYFVFKNDIQLRVAKKVEWLIINHFNAEERKLIIFFALYGESIGYEYVAEYLGISLVQLGMHRAVIFNKFDRLYSTIPENYFTRRGEE